MDDILGNVEVDGGDNKEEAAEAKVVKTPVKPTPEEVASHMATHLPYRDWCEICVHGKGQEDPHTHTPSDGPPGVPVIGWDYAFPRDHVHQAGEEGRPLLVQYDRTHKHVFADYVEKKGED